MDQDGTRALAHLQRELGRCISALDDTGEALDFDACVRPERGIDAQRRIAVYAHAYFARLHDVLRDDFPALAAALGEAAFHDLARLYLTAYPPRDFTLRSLGTQLCRFLAGPAARAFRERWPFAPDLAALERAITDVFDAQDRPLLGREPLARIPAESWPELRFEPIAALRLLQLDWSVERVRAAHDAGAALPAAVPGSCSVLVFRRDECVRYRSLGVAEAKALETLAAGEDFASVCAQIGSASAAVTCLERWLADGLLSAVIPGG